ncbi:MAG: Hsp20/alpha crystallin family protein [Gemmatimonadota bacterium]|nr:MAG: Hsp20/alpha crystallin family protein [Gemmatimonadota bacterium]
MENESDSKASGRGALAEFKDAVTSLFGQVTSLVPDFGLGREFPRHELRVEDEECRVLVELPGFKREEIDVSVAGRTLTVSGQRPRFEPPESGRMLRSERPSGDFELVVRLPAEVDALAVVAQMRDGILDARLPKSSGRGRSIEVEETSGGEEGSGAMPWEEGSEPKAQDDESGADDG